MSARAKEIKVSEIMIKDVLTAQGQSTVNDIMRLLNHYRVGAVIITDENKKVRGIVTESDVISAIVADGTQALFFACERIMNRELINVPPGHDFDTAYMMMSLNMVRRLPVTEKDGTLLGIITMRDIANAWRRKTHLLKQHSNQLEELARCDALSGAFNKTHATATIETYIKLGEKFSVMLIDIDAFKQINDTYGHIAGDIVIKQTAALIKAQVRAVDTVARYGGDEFIVICPVSDMESAHVAAERLRQEASEKVFSASGYDFHITLSIGLAESNEEMLSADDIIRLADNCLYQSKKMGKNTVSSSGFFVVKGLKK